MTGCSAYGCSNRSDQGYSLKCFPKDRSRRAISIAAVNRENWSPSQHSRLYQVHFEQEHFEKPDAEGKVKLKQNAIPTLFSHKKPQPKRPLPKVRAPLPRKRKIHMVEKEDEGEEKFEVDIDDNEHVKSCTNHVMELKRT